MITSEKILMITLWWPFTNNGHLLKDKKWNFLKKESINHASNGENTLYVPVYKRYPGFDLFYHDFENKSFYFIQVTIESYPMEHVMRNDSQVYNNQFKLNIDSIHILLYYA